LTSPPSCYILSRMAINVDLNMTRPLFVLINLRLLFRRWSIYAWFAVSLAFAGFIYFGLGQSTTNLIAACLLFPVFSILGIGFALGNILNRTYSPKNKNYFSPMQLKFDETGLTTVSKIGEGKRQWKEFWGWKKAAGCYLLYVSKSAYIAIPQSAVPRDRAGDFENLLNNKINADK
jgi:hypothetical protein